MDLSKVSTEDLKTIAKGKWSDVSTPGLQAYQSSLQQEQQAQKQSLNPQKIPDNADKAAQGNKDTAQAVSNQPQSPLMTYLSKMKSNYNKNMADMEATGLEKADQMAKTATPVAGTPPLVMPAGPMTQVSSLGHLLDSDQVVSAGGSMIPAVEKASAAVRSIPGGLFNVGKTAIKNPIVRGALGAAGLSGIAKLFK